MVELRVDPWDPEYGGSVEMEPDDEEVQDVDIDIEDVDWAPQAPAPVASLPRCAFVDGVRRIDVRLFAEEDEEVAPALAGSWTVGAAWSTQPPKIEPVHVGRELVVGGGLKHPNLRAEIGDHEIVYDYSAVEETRHTGPIQRLQNRMREAEGDLAEEIFESGAAELIVMDGPLTYFARQGPVLGLIKRQSRSYLQNEAAILRALGPGERTPLFVIEGRRLNRYAWYTRIARGRRVEGVMTGIVRLELSSEVGRAEAIRLADQSTAALPRFASQSAHDPRAPQNLYPVGRLESVLRHRLGDAQLVRRALETSLFRSNNSSSPSTDSNHDE